LNFFSRLVMKLNPRDGTVVASAACVTDTQHDVIRQNTVRAVDGVSEVERRGAEVVPVCKNGCVVSWVKSQTRH
jgi:hypothetical protein